MSTTEPTSNFATVNGLRLHYLDWGTAGKPILICLHGNTGQGRTWDYFARSMRDRYHVVALDQRGHGESQWAKDGYSRASYVADLAGFVDHLGETKVTLVGLSLGGLVSMGYTPSHPNRVEKLVLVDIAPEMSEAARGRMGSSRGYPLEFASLDEAEAWARGNYLWAISDGLRGDLEGRMRQRDDGTWVWKADPEVFNPSRPRRWAGETELFWKGFESIACPILEVRGLESDLISDETIERMKAANSLCQCIDIPGASHNVIVDKPAETTDAIRSFLGA